MQFAVESRNIMPSFSNTGNIMGIPIQTQAQAGTQLQLVDSTEVSYTQIRERKTTLFFFFLVRSNEEPVKGRNVSTVMALEDRYQLEGSATQGRWM